MNEFLYEKGGQTFQSIPVAVFYTKELRYLYHYTEFPRIYHKDRLAGAMRAARPGGTPQQTWDRFMGDWRGRLHAAVLPARASAPGSHSLPGRRERDRLRPAPASGAGTERRP